MNYKIDRKSLNSKLLDIGIDLDKKLFKSAQTAPTINYTALNSLKNKLVDNLYNKVAVKAQNPNAAEISTKLDKDIDVTGIPLENLGALVRFLTINQITVNNNRISYNSNEETSVPNKEKYKFFTLGSNAGLLEQTTRQPQQFGYFIDLDLLKAYLNNLVKNSKNKIEKVMIGKLINQANEDLDLNVTNIPTVTKNMEQALDVVPYMLDVKNPTQSVSSGKVITLNDISSSTAFNAWLQKSPEGGYGLNNKSYGLNDAEFNMCIYIQALYNRTRFLVSRAPSEELKTLYTTYMNNVATVSRGLTDNNGNSCNLAVNYINPSQDSNYKNVGYKENEETSGEDTSDSSLNDLFAKLPLLDDRIDFARIQDFLNSVEPAVDNSKDKVKSVYNTKAVNKAQTILQSIEHYFNNNEGVNLRSNVDEFASSIVADLNLTANTKDPNSKLKISQYLYTYIDYLKALLVSVRDVIDSLKNHIPPQSLAVYNKVLNDQTGNMSASKLSKNVNTLNHWKDSLPAYLKGI